MAFFYLLFETTKRGPFLRLTTGKLARRPRVKMIIDFLSLLDPNAVHSLATVGSRPARPRLKLAVRRSPIRQRVMSARLRPRLRRAAGRGQFVGWPSLYCPTAGASRRTSACLDVGGNCGDKVHAN